MTNIVKTGQEVVDHFEERRAHYSSRAISAESETKGSAPSHLRGKSLAMQEALDFLNDLFIGEVKFTDLKEARYVRPAEAQPVEPAILKEPIIQFFEWGHLPEHLQQVSKPFCKLAVQMVENLPNNPERYHALRKLLEAKDAAVRARLQLSPKEIETKVFKQAERDRAIPVDSSGMRDSHT